MLQTKGVACWTLVPLRLAIGAGLFAHGFAKLSHGPEHFSAIVAALGLPVPTATAMFVIAIELTTGLAILFGAFVRQAAFASALIVVTAILGVHLRYGFLSVRLVELTPDGARFGPVGYELGLVYLAALVALAASEPTSWSVDRWLRSRRDALSRRQDPGLAHEGRIV